MALCCGERNRRFSPFAVSLCLRASPFTVEVRLGFAGIEGKEFMRIKLRAEMPEVNSKIKQFVDEDLPKTNQLIRDAGVPFLCGSEQSPDAAQRRRK